MKLSKKKESELYGVISNDIMQARIEIWRMRDNKKISIAEIDDILSDLTITAPENAIDLFKPRV